MKAPKPNRFLSLLLLIPLFFASCSSRPGQSEKEGGQYGKSAVGQQTMVVTAFPAATEVGVAILQKGGNAVDAMVGVHFALAVVYPTAGNIGGGGFMVLRQQNGETATLDFREKAPGLAHETMYLDANGEVMEGESLFGQKAAGVPGSVDGVLRAHARYGSLPLAELIRPAVELAAKGFAISAQQAREFNSNRRHFVKYNADSLSLVLVKSTPWQEGDLLKQPDLARTLQRIQKEGRAGFYEGETARLLVAEMQRGNGIISEADLRNYEAVWRDPLIGSYKGLKVISMGPPSSGGIALLQMLKMSEAFPLGQLGHNTAQTVHLMTEIERRVYADRAAHLGDPDFWQVPQKELLDPAYLQKRVAQISSIQKTPSSEVQALSLAAAKESEQTTHYSIVDAAGNAVSVTTTLNAGYGSRVFVQGAGFLLNNEMDDFSIKPGVPNMYGLLGGKANAIAPNKRMLSSMTPTILEKDGKLLLVVGTPGGSTIMTSVYQTILNVLAHNMTLADAVAAKRFHHQWMPDVIYVEKDALPVPAAERLQQMGHQLESRGPIGRVDAILVQPDGTLHGAGDPRGDDWAGGF